MLRRMDPLTITAALLAAWGATKWLTSSGNASPPGFPIVIPPDPSQPWPSVTPAGALCPPNLPPPPDTVPIGPPYPKDLSPWGYKQLGHPKGTVVIDVVNGQLIVGRLETHYHPPGTEHVTATGCHKGLTAYVPSKPWLQIAQGTQVPGLTPSTPASTT